MSDPIQNLKYLDIKDKYFYRTERWDWLNEKMIHVYDSKSPRIITMDPWPQEIYLDAIGHKTVKEYIQAFYYRYPEGHAPKELNETIIEQLSGLIELNIVAFSDTPVTLDETILKPLYGQGNVCMKGTWKGTYTYSIPDKYKDEKMIEVGFTIRITTVDGQRFSGTVEDDLATGGTPGVGTISGRFTDNKISFDKNMPIYTFINEAGKHIYDNNKKHPTIIYTGVFGHTKRFVSGHWRFKKRVLVWKGFIPYWVYLGEGKFAMTKVNT